MFIQHLCKVRTNVIHTYIHYAHTFCLFLPPPAGGLHRNRPHHYLRHACPRGPTACRPGHLTNIEKTQCARTKTCPRLADDFEHTAWDAIASLATLHSLRPSPHNPPRHLQNAHTSSFQHLVNPTEPSQEAALGPDKLRTPPNTQPAPIRHLSGTYLPPMAL